MTQDVGLEWAGRKCIELHDLKMGFHAIPSLPQLHLHAISQVGGPILWMDGCILCSQCLYPHGFLGLDLLCLSCTRVDFHVLTCRTSTRYT